MSLTKKTAADVPQLTWEMLDGLFEQAVADGFHGAALLTRKGEIAYHKAFGLANREKQIPNRADTVFAIGSAPIDFTHAALQ